MTVLNLTPHVLNIVTPEGVVTIERGATVARVATLRVEGAPVAGIPTWETTFGEVTDLPAAREGVVLVVSALVQGHPSVRERADVFSPGEPVRDAAGTILGARGLSRAV